MSIQNTVNLSFSKSLDTFREWLLKYLNLSQDAKFALYKESNGNTDISVTNSVANSNNTTATCTPKQPQEIKKKILPRKISHQPVYTSPKMNTEPKMNIEPINSESNLECTCELCLKTLFGYKDYNKIFNVSETNTLNSMIDIILAHKININEILEDESIVEVSHILHKIYIEYFSGDNGQLEFLHMGCNKLQLTFCLSEIFKSRFEAFDLVKHGILPNKSDSFSLNNEDRYIVGDIKLMEKYYNDEQFNLIIINKIFNYVESIDDLVEECFRIIKEWGVIVVIDYNYDNTQQTHYTLEVKRYIECAIYNAQRQPYKKLLRLNSRKLIQKSMESRNIFLQTTYENIGPYNMYIDVYIYDIYMNNDCN